jgi:hypothetical protein
MICTVTEKICSGHASLEKPTQLDALTILLYLGWGGGGGWFGANTSDNPGAEPFPPASCLAEARLRSGWQKTGSDQRLAQFSYI